MGLWIFLFLQSPVILDQLLNSSETHFILMQTVSLGKSSVPT